MGSNLNPKSIGIDVNTLSCADYRGPAIPWIDPLREVKADVEAVNAGFKSRSQVIRQRGGDPALVREQLASEQKEINAKNLAVK